MLVPAEGGSSMRCDGVRRRRMFRCFVPAVEGVWLPAVHASCLHNEVAALALRTMGPTPTDPLVNGSWPLEVRRVFTELRVLVKKCNLEPWPLERVVASYKGALRRRYEQARLSLEDEGLGRRDFFLSGFLKAEKFNPLAKVSKPRLINPRSPRYNLVLASFLKPLEHALWQKWKVGWNCRPTRVSGKGLNPHERAVLVERKMASVGDCVVFEVDGKAFEAHVTRDQLLLEQSVYRAAYPCDPTLGRLLQVQLGLRGRTSGGVKYGRQGGRASGDFNTGLGNTILMGCFVIAAMRTLGTRHRWTVLADGDNCLLFLERALASSVHARFADLIRGVCAHEMTVEKPVTLLEQVTFGQSRPVRTARGLVMVRDPWKVLSGAFCGYRHYTDRSFSPRLIRAVAQAEASLSRGVPVLGPYFACAEALTRRYRPLREPDAFLPYHLLGVADPGPVPVTSEARRSFELAFGIGAEEQRWLEARLCDILRRHLIRVLDSGEWLNRTVQPVNGAGVSHAEDTADYLWASRR